MLSRMRRIVCQKLRIGRRVGRGQSAAGTRSVSAVSSALSIRAE